MSRYPNFVLLFLCFLLSVSCSWKIDDQRYQGHPLIKRVAGADKKSKADSPGRTKLATKPQQPLQAITKASTEASGGTVTRLAAPKLSTSSGNRFGRAKQSPKRTTSSDPKTSSPKSPGKSGPPQAMISVDMHGPGAYSLGNSRGEAAASDLRHPGQHARDRIVDPVEANGSMGTTGAGRAHVALKGHDGELEFHTRPGGVARVRSYHQGGVSSYVHRDGTEVINAMEGPRSNRLQRISADISGPVDVHANAQVD